MSVSRLLPLLIPLLAATGCALDDGNPWGRLELAAGVSFLPADDRLTPTGELLTINNEAVTLDRVALQVATIQAEMAGGDGPAAFDPANPPPGYSLCHGGHCHKDDGSLPTYAEIEAELAGSGAAAGPQVSWTATDDFAHAVGGMATIDTGDCNPGCDVGRGALTRWRVQIRMLALRGSVRSTASDGPLSGAARSFKATWPADVVVVAPAAVTFGPEHPPHARLVLTIELPASLLDDIDFATTAVGQAPPGGEPVDLSGATTAAMATALRLRQDTALRTHTTRQER